MRSSIACINFSCGIAEKQLAMSRLDHPAASPLLLIDEHLQRIMSRSPGPEPEGAVGHVGLEDRLEHDLQRSLHDTVTNCRDRQRPHLAAARLRDEHPPRRQRPIAPLPHLFSQLTEQPVNAVLLDLGQGGLVDVRRAIVPAHHNPRTLQHVPAEDLVEQRMEPTPGIGLGRPVERMLQGTDRITRNPWLP
nr:hypothetical protein [Nonomuraea sp. FMUSA5-5]